MRFSFRVAHNTISILLREVCQALFAEYKEEVWSRPKTPEEWKVVSDGFLSRWNYHHCIGAIDGKHIKIKKPNNSGSLYFNYKAFFSIVLMAVVDANYSFIWISVGHAGSSSDGGIFKRYLPLV